MFLRIEVAAIDKEPILVDSDFQEQIVGVDYPLAIVSIYANHGYSDAGVARQLVLFLIWYADRYDLNSANVLAGFKSGRSLLWEKYGEHMQLLTTYL